MKLKNESTIIMNGDLREPKRITLINYCTWCGVELDDPDLERCNMCNEPLETLERLISE